VADKGCGAAAPSDFKTALFFASQLAIPSSSTTIINHYI